MSIVWLGLAGLAIAWLLPGHYFPWTAFQQDAVAALGLLLIALGLTVSARVARLPLPWPLVVVFALAIVPALQWATGQIPFAMDALMSSGYLVAFALAILCGRQLAQQSEDFGPALFTTVGAGAIASVGIGLAQWLAPESTPLIEALAPGDRISGNLRQPNQLASLLALGLAAIWWAYESQRIGRAVAALAAGFLGWGLVMTQSRTAWLALLVCVVMWAAFARKLKLRTHWAAVVAGLTLFVIGVVAWQPLDDRLNFGSVMPSLTSRLDAGPRLLIWRTLVDALLLSPWTGYGWLQIPQAQQAALMDHPPTLVYLSSSHNQVLDILLWNGLPLGILVLLGLGLWTVTRIGACRSVQSWAFLIGIGVLAAHSMVEFPLQYAYFLLPVGLMVGAVEAEHVGSAHVPSVRRPFFAIVCALIAIALYEVCEEYTEVEESLRRLVLAQSGYVQPGAETRVPDVLLLDGHREYLRLLLVDTTHAIDAREMGWMTDVAARYPTPGALLKVAQAAVQSGNVESARHHLEVMCRISLPRHCDNGRARWSRFVEMHPKANVVPYPATPLGRTNTTKTS